MSQVRLSAATWKLAVVGNLPLLPAKFKPKRTLPLQLVRDTGGGDDKGEPVVTLVENDKPSCVCMYTRVIRAWNLPASLVAGALKESPWPP